MQPNENQQSNEPTPEQPIAPEQPPVSPQVSVAPTLSDESQQPSVVVSPVAPSSNNPTTSQDQPSVIQPQIGNIPSADSSHGNGPKKKILLVAIPIVILVVAGAIIFSQKGSSPKKVVVAVSHGSTSSGSAGTSPPNDNTLRTADAKSIAGAAEKYLVRATPSLLPKSLYDYTDNSLIICGSATCTANTEPSGTAVLEYYKEAAVSIVSYTAGLTVPDASTVYIVVNELCNSSDSGLGQISSSDIGSSFAVLYALKESSGIQQQCFDSSQALSNQ